MPDQLKDPLNGPDGIYDTTAPPSRGDWHSLAVAALTALGVPVPTSRYEATVAAVRIHQSIDQAASTNPIN